MSRKTAAWMMMAPAVFLASGKPAAPPEKVQLTIATLHAAALTTPRNAGDNSDAPFFVVQVIGAKKSFAAILSDTGSRTVRLNEALGARPLTELSLAVGDSVQVLVSVLESATLPGDTRLAAPAETRGASTPEQEAQVSRVAAPMIKDGARLLGSVSMLVTNEAGSIFWRRLECVSSCKVLNSPSSSALAAGAAQPSGGVVELSGNGGTYHLALNANHAP